MTKRRRDPEKEWVEVGFEPAEVEALERIMIREGIPFRATAVRFAVLAAARQLRKMIVTQVSELEGKPVKTRKEAKR